MNVSSVAMSEHCEYNIAAMMSYFTLYNSYFCYFQLESGPYANYYHALHLFAYGTYRQYLENKPNLLELTPVQKKKLQHLTIVTLATKNKVWQAHFLDSISILFVLSKV